MDFLKYATEKRNELINGLTGLLQIDTVLKEQPEVTDAPFGENLVKALNYTLDYAKKLGFTVKNIDNVAGHIEYGEGDEIIGILAHLDVVPAGDGWKYDPFDATIVDDKLYARGALDDKGAVFSSIYALKALKDNNIKLNKRVRIILGTDEETSSRGIKRYLEKEQMPDMSFSPDAEYPLIYGEKGIMSLDIDCEVENEDVISFTAGDRYNVVPEVAKAVLKKDYSKQYKNFLLEKGYTGTVNNNEYIMYGKRAHGMQPEKGENAALRLIEFLNMYIDHPVFKFACDCLMDTRVKDMGLNFTDHEMGDLTMNVAVFNIDSKKAHIGINYRYPIRFDIDEFICKFSDIAKKYNIKTTVINDSKPHYVSPNSPLVKTLLASYIKYTSDTKNKILTIGGGTYARSMKNAVAFGPLLPGRADICHQVNEYVHVSDLILSVAIFADAICELGK